MTRGITVVSTMSAVLKSSGASVSDSSVFEAQVGWESTHSL